MRSIDVVRGWHTEVRLDRDRANEKYLADDIQLLLPRSRPIVGKAAVSAHLAGVGAAFERIDYSGTPTSEYTVMFGEGNLVGNRFRWLGTTKAGDTVDIFVFNLYLVEDDKIRVFEEHFDTNTRYQHSYSYEPSDYFEGYDAESRLVVPNPFMSVNDAV